MGAVAALAARHDGMITATLAIQDDLPEWLRVTALGDVAGDTACRRYGVSAERCSPGRGAKGRRVERGYARLFGSPSVVPQLSSVGGSLLMAARPPLEGSSRVSGWAELLSGDCVSTGVSALFFTYGRKCKK